MSEEPKNHEKPTGGAPSTSKPNVKPKDTTPATIKPKDSTPTSIKPKETISQVLSSESNAETNTTDNTTASNATTNTNSISTGNKLDKAILSNLNKSLKAKQKIISLKEPLPKNSAIITEIINRSPTATSFPMNQASGANSSISTNVSSPDIISDSIPNLQLNENINDSKLKKSKMASSKQNSTRTDFFAAKLASAVDDVDSSDSDETFVYENNNNDFNVNNANGETNVEEETSHDNEINEEQVKENNETIEESKDVKDETASVVETHSNHETDNESHNEQPEISNESKPNEHPDQIEDSDDENNTTIREAENDTKHSTIKSNIDLSTINKSEKPTKTPHTINSNSKPMMNSSLNSSFASSNQFLDGLINKNLRPNNQRTLSTHSIENHPSITGKPPLSPFNNASTTSDDDYNSDENNGYTDDDNLDKSEMELQTGDDDSVKHSDNEVVDVDDVSSHDSYNSTKHTSNSTLAHNKSKNVSSNNPTLVINNASKNVDSTNSITSKSTKKKSTTSSSKLRSTTSKLFDKKGAQPRRYSIIPDDIDIEDFDDELIYYDNNIRFPHNGQNFSTNSYLNENSPLMNSPRIHHYRSLNLNPQKRANKNKRYLSTGGQILTTPPHTGQNLNPNQPQAPEVFPFPYNEQPNPNQYYYGFDEYDDESASMNDQQFDKVSRKGSANFNFDNAFTGNYDSPNNQHNHFFLPRKKSFIIDANYNGYDYNYIKRTIYTLISILGILSIGFIMGFVIATTKDLTHVNIIGIENPIVSQDELVFNIIVEALNPGWFTIGIEDVELDIFAKSGYLPGDGDDEGKKQDTSVETVLLGSIYTLESPVYFQGGFFNRDLIHQSGEIKLVSPGKNLTNIDNSTKHDNSEKWEVISKNPFDLIIRGILKYNLPISKNVKSVVVTRSSYIDPNEFLMREVNSSEVEVKKEYPEGENREQKSTISSIEVEVNSTT